ncbi:MAG: DUF1570 domain-containing protein [Planctomycetota bacterium]
MTRKLTVVFAVLVCCGGLLHSEEITVRTSSGIKMHGEMKSVSEDGIVLLWKGREKKFSWADLHPETVYEIRSVRLNAGSAEDHIQLGDYCAKNNLPEQAKKEYQTALKLDPALRDRVQEAIARLSPAAEEKPAPGPTETPKPKPEEEPAPKAPPDKPAEAPKQMTAAELKAAGAELMQKMHEDPAKYYNEWIQLQKIHLKQIEEQLEFNFFTYETDHYIYHSTMSPAVTKKISNGCEDLYKKMTKTFEVGKGDLLWAGKCIVNLFEEPNQFAEFAVKIDGFDDAITKNVGGYFSHRGRFVHIAIPKTEQGGKGFESTLIHEGAHAFLQLFNEDVFIKPWIHEGVAQYFEYKCFPNDPEWRYKKMAIGSERMLLADLRAADTFITPDAAKMSRYYAFSWSALDFMIRANPKKFVKFIRALKKGKSEEEAIEEGFGCTMREFEQSWVTQMRKGL